MGRSASDAVTKPSKSPDVRRHNTNPDGVKRPDQAQDLTRAEPRTNLACIEAESNELDLSMQGFDNPTYITDNVPSTEL